MSRLCLVAVLMTAPLIAAENELGAQVFQRVCSVCHEQANAGGRVPPTAQLRKLPATTIRQALESGVMQSQGANLSGAERTAVAAYLGIAPVSLPAGTANRCPADPSWKPVPPGPKDSWGMGLENRRYQESGGIPATQVPKLKLRWAFAMPDAVAVRSQPAVYGGRVFIGAQDGAIFALDAKTGCTHWTAKVNGQVRSGISVAVANGKPLVLAGDVAGTVSALDAATGTIVWQRRLDLNPYTMVTSTPVVYNGRVYAGTSSREEPMAAQPGYVCCTFRGSVSALNLADGAVIWKTWTLPEPPTPRGISKRGNETMGPSGAGVWAPATVDPSHNLIYITTGDNYSDPTTDTSDALLALDLNDGRILWSKQFTKGDAFNNTCVSPAKTNCPDSDGPDHDFGTPAILVNLPDNRRALLLGQKSGMMHAVDPDRKGEILWQSRIGKGGPLGGIQWGPATDGAKVYVALSDIGFTGGSAATGLLTDPNSGGGIFALQVTNGERVWQTPNKGCEGKKPCSPAQSAAVTAIPGAVFSGSVDGHLRAYNAQTGAIVWDYDAAHEFTTVNGVKGTGGSFDGGGPVISGGMLFAGSGYGSWGGIPGNVLLAFSPE